jgi:peptide/nickel transport system permease protein
MDAAVDGSEQAERQAGDGRLAGLRWRRVPTEGKIGLGIVVGFLAVAIIGPMVAPYDPAEIGVGPPVGGPSLAYPLGTDDLGRDVLSRVLHGGGSVVLIPFLATVVAFIVGGSLGMITGYLGGPTDMIGSRAIDVLLSLPAILMVLVVVTTAGRSDAVLIIATGLVFAPRVARVLRGATRNIAQSEYVQAAQARGERTPNIVGRELLPNISPTLFVEFASRLSFAIIFVATLNFLGLGLQPPSPNWGVMVSESRKTIATTPLATIAPALAIGILSVGIGLIADAATQVIGGRRERGFRW